MRCMERFRQTAFCQHTCHPQCAHYVFVLSRMSSKFAVESTCSTSQRRSIVSFRSVLYGTLRLTNSDGCRLRNVLLLSCVVSGLISEDTVPKFLSFLNFRQK